MKKIFRAVLRLLNIVSKKEEAVDKIFADKSDDNPIPEFVSELSVNLSRLKDIIGTGSDIVYREFICSDGTGPKAAIIYIDGMVDLTQINEDLLRPLMQKSNIDSVENLINYVDKALIFSGNVRKKVSYNEAVANLLSGDTILLIDGAKEALILGLRGWKSRSIDEPQTESVVRGSREGFTESIRTNTSLLRRRIKNPNLTFDTIKIGLRTKTDVCVAYIRDLAAPSLIEEVKHRLARIDTDSILESGYIEQYIEDAPYSIFPTVANSEKPDKVAAKILEGRAAIFIDGTPFVLTVPMMFFENFQSAEDYYSRPYFASFIRIIRYISFFMSITFPALYVALSTFHQEMIPTPLLLTMMAAHDGVPFPSVLEALLMMIAFDILREGGLRLARPIGQAVSIVGALVIGDAAVSAGLVGAPMVIVVAITAVASFVVSSQTDSGTIIRYFLLILAGFTGGLGIAVGLLLIFLHLASLRSFGTPYLSALAPFNVSDMKDIFIRAPMWMMRRRPVNIDSTDTIRQARNQKPVRPDKEQAQDR